MLLIALATSRHRSFLHALSVAPSRCIFRRGDVQLQVVVNLPEAGFLAKNQLLLQAPTWIQVPGISHLNPDKPERMLCPVRQLQLYLRDSNSIRGGWQNLFIHWDRNLDDIVSTHIKVDRGGSQTGLQWSRTPVRPDHGTRVRAVSTSWAYANQVALEDVLAAAFWRSSGVFRTPTSRRCLLLVTAGTRSDNVRKFYYEPFLLKTPWFMNTSNF